jgi:hypothetical protein
MNLTDPRFKWIPAASHDADSRPFYERQMARIAAAEKARQSNSAEAAAKVKQINRKKA